MNDQRETTSSRGQAWMKHLARIRAAHTLFLLTLALPQLEK